MSKKIIYVYLRQTKFSSMDIQRKDGGRRGIRTPNLSIWNRTLYRWSYTPALKTKGP